MNFKCQNCLKCFTTKRRLETHLNKKNKCKRKTTINTIVSDYSKITPITPKLLQNYSKITPVKKDIFRCDYCGQEFKRKWNLNRHLDGRCSYLRRSSLDFSETENEPSETDSENEINTNEPVAIQNDPVAIQNDPVAIQNDPVAIQNDPFNIKINNSEIIKKYNIQDDNDELTCQYCGKKFTLVTNKNRHEKYRCKSKKTIIEEQQKTIEELKQELDDNLKILEKKEKKIIKRNKTLERVYTEKEILSNAVSNYNVIVNSCINSRDLMLPQIIYTDQIPKIEYSYDKKNKETYNNIEEIDEKTPTITMSNEHVAYYIGLGAKDGVSAMIKKLLVNNIDVINRGVWCFDPTRSRFLIKRNGIFINDNNGQRLLDIIMPGIENLFHKDSDFWREKLLAEKPKSTVTLINYTKRQTFLYHMNNKKVRRKIAKDIGAPLCFDRKEILEQIKEAKYDNTNIIFDDQPVDEIN